MSIIMELYDPSKTYIAPNGEIYDNARVLQEWQAANIIPYVVGTDSSHTDMQSMDKLSTLCNQYNIDSTLTDSDKVNAIILAIEAKQAADAAATAAAQEAAEEEAALKQETLLTNQSIAWNLEYQNLINS